MPSVVVFTSGTDLDVASSSYRAYIDSAGDPQLPTPGNLSIGGIIVPPSNNTIEVKGWSLDGADLGFFNFPNGEQGATTELEIITTAVRYISIYLGLTTTTTTDIDITIDCTNVTNFPALNEINIEGPVYGLATSGDGNKIVTLTSTGITSSSPICIVEIDLGASYTLNGSVLLYSPSNGTGRFQMVQMSNIARPANCLLGETLVRVGMGGPVKPLKDLTTFKAVTRDADGEAKEVDAKVICSKTEGVLKTVLYKGVEVSPAHLLMVSDAKEDPRENLKCRKCKGTELYGQPRCSRCGGVGPIKDHKPLVAADGVEAGLATTNQAYGRWYHVLLEDGTVHEPFELGTEGILSEPLRHVFGTARCDKLWVENRP